MKYALSATAKAGIGQVSNKDLTAPRVVIWWSTGERSREKHQDMFTLQQRRQFFLAEWVVDTRVYMTIITTSTTLFTPPNLEGDEAVPLEYLRNQIVCIISLTMDFLFPRFLFCCKLSSRWLSLDDMYYSSPSLYPGERSIKNRWWPRAPGLQCTHT